MRPFYIYILAFILIHSTSSLAQFVEIGGFGGVYSFNGDVNEGDVFSNTNAAFGGFVRYNFHPKVSCTLTFLKGTLEAKDRNSQLPHIRERNLSFQSDLMEFSLVPEFNILNFYPRKSSQVFAPYIGAGFAVIIFDPKTKYNGEMVSLQQVGTEGQGLDGFPAKYDLVSIAIPLIVGLKYSIGGRINIAIEIGYRFTFTDYIDDVSQIYLSPKTLAGNGEIAVALANRTEEYTGVPADDLIGTRRGNSNNNDAYLAWGLRLSFNLFGKKSYDEKKIPYQLNKWM